jgi:hypothetical protein
VEYLLSPVCNYFDVPAEVRLREHGHFVFGEIFIVPRTEASLPEQLAAAAQAARDADWRVHDIVVQIVRPKLSGE